MADPIINPFGDEATNATNRTRNIQSSQTRPVSKIVDPPKDAEGNLLVMNNAGSFVSPDTLALTITPEQLAALTNDGQNTDIIYQYDSLNDIPLQGSSDGSSNVSDGISSGGISNPVDGNVNNGIQNGSSGTIGPDGTFSPDIIVVGGGNSDPVGDSAIAQIVSVMTDESRMIDRQMWEYDVELYNHKHKFFPRPHVIKQLVIEDNLTNWPLRGYIILDNTQEVFERGNVEGQYYHIRGDARDEIKIRIFPNPSLVTLPDTVWKIDDTFVVYDVEDLPSDNLANKIKKLYFWSKYYQLVIERNIEWSSATTKIRKWTPPVPEPVEHATDDERAMYTGDIILSMFKSVGVPCDETLWDRGMGKINYVAKSNWTIWENISYVLSIHLDQKIGDQCVLQWDRGTKMLTLRPLNEIYDEAGKDTPGPKQIEHFFFEETPDEVSSSAFKAPYNEESGTEIDIKMEEYNKIMSYRFNQTSGLDNSQALTTHPVHSHWHKGKQFNIDTVENEIEHTKEFFKKSYVSKLLGDDYPVFVLNKTKKEQLSIHPVYSRWYNGGSIDTKKLLRSTSGSGRIILAGILQNQCLVIRVNGSTHRITGTFVGVDHLGRNSDTNYDYALCGQYLVVHVRHLMQHQKFVNELTLVKIHAYAELNNFEEVY